MCFLLQQDVNNDAICVLFWMLHTWNHYDSMIKTILYYQHLCIYILYSFQWLDPLSGLWLMEFERKNLDLKFAHFEHKLISFFILFIFLFFIVLLFLLLLLLLLWQQWINCLIHSTYTPIACNVHHITSHPLLDRFYQNSGLGVKKGSWIC